MKRALLIEDEMLNRKLMRDILGIKFSVWVAESADDARTILANEIPDVIFLDMQLPTTDGFSFLKELKANPKTTHVPVIAVSAMAFEHDIKNGIDNGCLEYVTKPIEEEPYAFVERMAALVDRQREIELAPAVDDAVLAARPLLAES